MPNIKSAKKQMRIAQRRRMRNKPVRSQTRTAVYKAEALILSGQIKPAEAEMLAAISSLDRGAEKGIIHKNNAARRKSRLMKKLNKAKAKPPAK